MNGPKPLYEILGHDDQEKELYVSDQKKRKARSLKGPYSRTPGLFNFLQLIKSWEDIVGTLMAQNTIPLKIKNHTLYISTKHAIFAQELGFLAPMIIEKIKKTFPDIDENLSKVKFAHSNLTSDQFAHSTHKAGPKPQKNKSSSLHPFSPAYLEKKSQAAKLFQDIDDPEIKKILTDFMLS